MNERTNPNDDRFNDLENFSNKIVKEAAGESLVLPLSSVADRVFGAQRVAVKRVDATVLAKISVMAAAAGDDWYYSWMVKNKDGTKTEVSGPSIKLANDVSRIYGNCDVDVRVIEDEKSWTFYARFIDLETGYSLTRPYQQRKNQTAGGKMDADRARDIAFQIGASKAIRNVVCNALQTFADYAVERARLSLVEKIGKDLDAWRARVLEALANQRIDHVRVERVIGRAAAQWLAPDVAKIVAAMKAIAEGMASWEDAFPIAAVVDPLSDHDPETGEVTQEAGNAKPAAAEGAKNGAGSPAGASTAQAAVGQPAQAETRQQAPGPAQDAKPAAEEPRRDAAGIKIDDRVTTGPQPRQEGSGGGGSASGGSVEITGAGVVGGGGGAKPAAAAEPAASLANRSSNENYIVGCKSFFTNAKSASAIEDFWKRERVERRERNLIADELEDLSAAKDARLRELRG